MKASDMFPSRYLKASDLGEATPIVTIASVGVESLGSEEEKENKPVLYFEGKDKGLVCNKTNWSTLTDLFGEETDDWKGKKIKLMTAEVAYKGKMTLCIRISLTRVPQATSKVNKIQNQTEPANDESSEEIPF